MSAEDRLYSDSIDPVLRAGPHELFLITIEARPEPRAPEFATDGGAFVNCWINVDDLRSAERRAIELIEEYGWRPHRFDNWRLVSRATYADREPNQTDELDSRDYLEQAFVDGETVVFNTWPIDAVDANDAK